MTNLELPEFVSSGSERFIITRIDDGGFDVHVIQRTSESMSASEVTERRIVP